LNDFRTYSTGEHVAFLIGNKIDLTDQVVIGESDVSGFLDRYPEIRYFPTSAANGDGIQTMFHELLLALPEPPAAIQTIPPAETDQRYCFCF
jgi:hypothetical protein